MRNDFVPVVVDCPVLPKPPLFLVVVGSDAVTLKWGVAARSKINWAIFCWESRVIGLVPLFFRSILISPR